MLSEILRESRELPWQPNFGKNKPKRTDFSSAQKIEDFSTQIVRFTGSANSNMLSEISSKLRELPWQQ